MAIRRSYQNRVEVLQGTLDILILKTLQWGPQHGYGIAQALRARSEEMLQIETGSLYPALHRLERQGWVHSDWKQTDSNQRAKFYRLTPAGKKHLAADLSRWQRIVQAMTSIIDREPEGNEV
jgi:PadR family transcriptional regulator, regulatory protein PadR